MSIYKRRALRQNYLTPLVNLRSPILESGEPSQLPAHLTHPPARLNICSFRVEASVYPFEIKLLERHLYSSQMFIPLSKDGIYYVIVSLGKEEPDLSTLKIFKSDCSRGFNYKPGIWHHPMVVFESQIDFVMQCFERNESQSSKDEDTKVFYFSESKWLEG
jgi:ureidoglycolate hydrolase